MDSPPRNGQRNVAPPRVHHNMPSKSANHYSYLFRTQSNMSGQGSHGGRLDNSGTMAGLTAAELNAVGIIVRTCSTISLLGSIFIFATYTCSSAFRNKALSRLVFYSSFGNITLNLCWLTLRAFLTAPDSFGCQFQALLMQWSAPTNTSWSLAMAINVYLTIYRRFDARRLRKLEIAYILACYGIPLISAVTFLFARYNGQRIYGDAGMWCWISADFNVLRMTTTYGPIWLCIFLALSIYIRAGHTIFKIRRELRNSVSSNRCLMFDVFNEPRTEVRVTESTGDTHLRATSGPSCYGGNYSVSVIAGIHSTKVNPPVNCQIASGQGSTDDLQPIRSQISTGDMAAQQRNYESKSAARSYTIYALLFLIGVVVTWIPPSANRIYEITHGVSPMPLVFMHAAVAPLQSIWNCVIYITISWVACKNLFQNLKARLARLWVAA